LPTANCCRQRLGQRKWRRINHPALMSEAVALPPTQEPRRGATVTDVGRPTLPDDSQRPRGDGWWSVARFAIRAVAVTVTVVLTDSLDLAGFVATVLHGR